MSACVKCEGDGGAGKLGLCRTCRLRLFSLVKYHWTSAMDDQLRQGYRSARSKRDLTAVYDRLQTQFRMPRYVIMNRAQNLCLRMINMRTWTREELEYVRENAGTVPVARMAKRLRRSPSSVKQYLFAQGLAGKVTEGYSSVELSKLFGVSHSHICRWVERGLLTRSRLIDERITHESVVRFVMTQVDEYSLRRVEEWWLKSLLKEALAKKGPRCADPSVAMDSKRRTA